MQNLRTLLVALTAPPPRGARRSLRRRAMKGMTLVEIMIVVVIMGLIASAVGIAVFDQAKKAKNDTARSEARTIEHAAQLWQQDHSGCPTMAQLVSDRVLSSRQRTRDPWDNEYVIACESGEVYVHSKGPDGNDGTDDDQPRNSNGNGNRR